ncbi:MAG TPA: NAD-dependent epimerase/dehydratase family protein [Acidimicrobiales bacterium]|nr:NAD-dependent epimerase/dehydratase family protein [Acidimicrobiales bacterium]
MDVSRPSSARRRAAHSVLVLGAGFLGSHLVRSLLDNGHRVTVLSRSRPHGRAQRLTAGAEVVVGDAGVTKTLAEAVVGVDHVVFALGSLVPPEAEQEPHLDLSLTLQPLLELLGVLAQGPRLPVSYLSSGGTVYGNAPSFPIPETAPTVPLSAYGITRLTAERFILRYGSVHDADVRLLRIGNAYGTGQTTARGQGIVGTALERCRTGEPLVLYGDEEVWRDFVHAEDIASTVAALVDAGGPAVVNIGSGVATAMGEVVALAREVSGRPLTTILKDGRDFDVRRVQLDISVLRSLVDYSPRSLREGMQQVWADMTAPSLA